MIRAFYINDVLLMVALDQHQINNWDLVCAIKHKLPGIRIYQMPDRLPTIPTTP